MTHQGWSVKSWLILFHLIATNKISTWHYRQWKMASEWYSKTAQFVGDSEGLGLLRGVEEIIEKEFVLLNRKNESEINYWKTLSVWVQAKKFWFEGDFESAKQFADQAAKNIKDVPPYIQSWLLPHIRAWQAITHLTWLSTVELEEKERMQEELLVIFWARDSVRWDAKHSSKNFEKDKVLLSATMISLISNEQEQIYWSNLCATEAV